MLSTGIRTDVGIKVYGQSLDTIYAFSQKIKKELDGIPGIKDLYVEPITGGKYIDVVAKRDEIGRYGLSIDDVNAVVESALGGMKLTTTVEGRQRFSVNARFGQDFRNNLDALKRLQVQTMKYGPIPLEAVADVKIAVGPPMINSENAMLRGTVLFNVRERDLASTVKEAKEKLDKSLLKMPKGYFMDWSGQYENLIRGEKTLKMIMPVVVLIIFFCMYLAFHSAREALISLISILGAAKRLRPKLMTVCVSLFGLVPILWSTGVGSDVMIPIVLPMIGGVLTSSTYILLVTPLTFLMTKEYELRKNKKIEVIEVKH
jgi:Cu(I)/Ag(I) efflux system membrane protein CusA/SilA